MLRESEARHRELLEVLGEGICIVDESETFVMANPAAERIFGVGPHGLVGMNLRTFIEDADWDRIRNYTRQRMQGISDKYEIWIRRRDGMPTALQVTATPRFDAHGTYSGSLAICRDVTEQKHAEEETAKLQGQLLQSQKMESLGTLAGGIAHDMNNVLGAVLGLASANIEAQVPGSPAHRAFGTIIKAATRGGLMIKSLLSFTRQSPAEERQLDVNAILQEETRLLERTTLSKVCLELDLEPDLHPILGDAGALSNAFMNLCINALDALPKDGTLALRTRNVDSDWIEVTVEDTGTGMPKEVLERAMDPFFTTKEMGKGTGLGLSMVFNTVKAHKGQMDIQSEPGLGTMVRMRFPACEPAAETVEPTAESRPVRSQRMLNVLLVDDDELIRSSMQAILQTMDHAVFTTSSGEEALLTIEAGFEPDVVILDMNMPGLGGSGTLPRLRAMLPDVPVLLSTGRADQVALDLAHADPHVTLLPKPFNITELQQCLEPPGRG